MNYSNLTLNVGGMFSGKTTELLRQGKRHLLAKDKVVYIKPNIDNRYSDTKVVSHTGDYTEALVVAVDEPIYRDATKNADVILVDEIQFFDRGVVLDILMLLQLGKKVYCSGLDLSFDHKPFEVTSTLMAFADNVNKFKAVCECGRDAYITAKKGGTNVNNNTVDIGADDKYIPLCRECYMAHNIGGVVNG